MKKAYNIINRFFDSILLSLICFIILIGFGVHLLQQQKIQNYLLQQALPYISEILQTELSVGDICINIFDEITINEMYLEDWHCDTLLYIKKLHIDINRFDLFKKILTVEGIRLENPYVRLQRKTEDEQLNLLEIINALQTTSFSTDKDTASPTKKDSTLTKSLPIANWLLDLNYIHIQQPRFELNDQPAATFLQASLADFNISIDTLNIDKQLLVIQPLIINQPNILLNIGKKITSSKKKSNSKKQNKKIYKNPKSKSFDWQISVPSLTVNHANFELNEANAKQKLNVGLEKLHIPIQKLAIDRQQIAFGNINLYKPAVQLVTNKSFSGKHYKTKTIDVEKAVKRLVTNEKTKKKTSPFPWDISLTALKIHRPTFELQDAKTKDKLQIDTRQVAIKVKKMHLPSQKIALRQILIDRPNIDWVIERKRKTKKKRKTKNKNTTPFSVDWDISLAKFNITQPKFHLKDENTKNHIHAKAAGFHLLVDNMNLPKKQFNIRQIKLQRPDVQWETAKETVETASEKTVENLVADPKKIKLDLPSISLKQINGQLGLNIKLNQLLIEQPNFEQKNTIAQSYIKASLQKLALNQLILNTKKAGLKNLNIQQPQFELHNPQTSMNIYAELQTINANKASLVAETLDFQMLQINQPKFDLRNSKTGMDIHTEIQTIEATQGNLAGKTAGLQSLQINQPKFDLQNLQTGQDIRFNGQIIEAVQASVMNQMVGLQALQINQPNFYLNDEGAKTELNVALNDLTVENTLTNLNIQLVDFDAIKLSKPNITLNLGIKPDDDEEEDKTQIVHLNTSGWTLQTKVFDLSEGYFALSDEKDLNDYPNAMNYRKLRVSDINFNFNALVFGNDTITSRKARLSAREKSGIIIEQLNTDKVVFSTTHLELHNLDLKTPDSHLRDYLRMDYNTLYDFEDFENQVKMRIHFAPNSFFVFKDINYFAKQLSEVDYIQQKRDQIIYLSGNVKGKVKHLRGKNINIHINDTHLAGDFRIRGLPDFLSSSINLDVSSLTTDIQEIKDIYPPIKLPSSFNKLGQLHFKGRFRGFPKDFIAHGELQTDLGIIRSDINMEIDGKIPNYSGSLIVENFDLGAITNQQDLGTISFATDTLNGRGLHVDDIDVYLQGKIQHITFKDYTYRDILIHQGTIKRKRFEGSLAINDKNLQIAQFNGSVDLNNDIPRYSFSAGVNHLNINNLRLISPETLKKNIIIEGTTSLDMRGNDIDNIEGIATFEDVTVHFGEQSIKIDDMKAASFKRDEYRDVSLASSIVNAHFDGIFNFKELPNAIQNYLHTYFPYRFDSTEETAIQFVDSFYIDLKQPTTLAQLFEPKIELIEKGYVTGALNTDSKIMNLKAQIPRIIFDGVAIDSLDVDAYSNAKRINFNTFVNQVDIKGRLLPEMKLIGAVFNDSIDFKFKLAKDHAPTRAYIDGLLFANRDTLTMAFDTTELVINHKKWAAQTGTFVYKNKDYFKIGDIELSQGNQLITVNSNPKPNESYKNITEIALENLIIEDFQEINAIKKMHLSGVINGAVGIQDLFGEQLITASLAVSHFVFLDQEIGLVQARVEKKKGSNKIDIRAAVDESAYKLYAKGGVYLPIEEQQKTTLDIDVNATKLPLFFLNAFVGDFVSELEGKATGKLRFSGLTSQPNINGRLFLPKGAAKIDFLQTKYFFNNETVDFDNKTIALHDFKIRDKHGHQANVFTELKLNDFKDLRIKTRIDSDNFLFMETSLKDNESFYGTAYGSGFVTIEGPFDKLKMYINAQSKPGTAIYLPMSAADELVENEIYTFINTKTPETIDTNTLATIDSITQKSGGFDIDFDLDITPDAELQIIFDQEAGDIIKGRGYGDIQMQVSTIDDFIFNIYGNYKIEQGQYLFTFQDLLVNKPFNVKKGGTVSFNGDPYQALLDVNAIYSTKASRSDFLSEEEQATLSEREQNALFKRVPVDLHLNLAGILSKPDITFDIVMPDPDVGRLKNVIEAKLSELVANDQNELNKQVFGLMVLNKFLPSEDVLDVNNLRAGVGTTISEFLSNQLSAYLGEAVASLIPGSDFNINWRNYAAGSNGDFRNEIELVFTKRFGDRVSIDIGGNLDVGDRVQADQRGNVAVAGDFVIEYKITADGRLKLRAFNKYDYDIFTGDFNKTGVSFSVTQDFDSFEELFRKKKKREEKEE